MLLAEHNAAEKDIPASAWISTHMLLAEHNDVPEIIRAAITTGMRQAPFYPNIIA